MSIPQRPWRGGGGGDSPAPPMPVYGLYAWQNFTFGALPKWASFFPSLFIEKLSQLQEILSSAQLNKGEPPINVNHSIGISVSQMGTVGTPRGSRGVKIDFRKTSFLSVSRRNFLQMFQGGSPRVKKGQCKFDF